MPYITCEDGQTYSRYDNSPYVRGCIERENKQYDSLYKACTLDPHCRHQREVQNKVITGIAIIGVILIAFFVIYFIKIMTSITKE